jgi:hypothetical protein
MKKYIALLCAVLILAGLVGCGAEKELAPIEKVQARAAEIGQQFLDGELSEKEAKEKLDSLKVPEVEGNGQLYLETDINYLSFIIGINDSTYEEIQEKVDWIAGRNYLD